MGNPAVDLAITGLEAVGVPITPSMASLVELLLNDGLDVLTEVPRIVGIIEGLGGSAFHVLEEVASGMAVSGPVGYVQRQVDNYTAPYRGKAQEIKHGKQRLTDLHRANLQSVKNQVTALYSQNPGTGTGSVTSYSGPAADTMMASFNTVLTQTDSLLNVMDQSQQIDADLQTDLENIVKTIIVLVIIDLIVFAIVFIVVFVGVALGLLVPAVALAPETGGLSLPADPAVAGTAAFAAASAITGGLVGAEVVGVFALFLYAYGRWAVRHVMLKIAPPTAVSHSLPLISSGTTLPNPPLTPAEGKLANDLFHEFGGAIPEEVLQYLVKLLGASALSAAMIRCLYQSGYLDLSNSVYRWQPLENDYNNAWTNIVDHLDPNDLEGAWKEANPSEVDPSTIPPGSRYVSGGDHAKEVQDALNSIDNLINSIDGKINDYTRRIPNVRDPKKISDMIDKIAHLRKVRDVFDNLRTVVRSKIGKGSPSPDTWPDQGKLPITEELLQTSSCKVPDAKYYK